MRAPRKFQPERLRHLMDENAVSGYQLEKFLGKAGVRVARSTVLSHANGDRDPRSSTVGAYASFFNVPVDYFYSEL